MEKTHRGDDDAVVDILEAAFRLLTKVPRLDNPSYVLRDFIFVLGGLRPDKFYVLDELSDNIDTICGTVQGGNSRESHGEISQK